jgi:5-methylcytosine-specific restriction endonuclease McrA
MAEEWKGTKAQREALRAKFGGRCGYCGEPLTKMHADHVEPITRITTDPWGHPLPADQRRFIRPERNVVSNMMPACGPCNISKGGYSLEKWREMLERSHEIVAREKSIFRAGVRFGVIKVTGQPVVFHFEREDT